MRSVTQVARTSKNLRNYNSFGNRDSVSAASIASKSGAFLQRTTTIVTQNRRRFRKILNDFSTSPISPWRQS